MRDDRDPDVIDGLEIAGRWRCWITNPDGTKDGDDFYVDNGIATAGINYLLEAGFRGGSAISSWYAGLINGSGFSSVSSNDTAGSHAGWTEMTGYTEANRQQWSPGAASGGVIANGTAMAFTINATGSIQGLFIISNNTKGGTTGTLWSTAAEASPRSVTSGQTFNAIYELTGTPVS